MGFEMGFANVRKRVWENMTENVLLFASSKGGVGKSTVALGLARALAAEGRRVLLADFDFCSPCLDLLCGVEDHVLYTVSDLAQEKCSVENALLRPCEQELYLLPAVQEDLLSANGEGRMSSEQNTLLGSAVQKAAEQMQADFVLIDTGAGVSTGLEAAAAIAHSAVIVAGHTPASIRAAGRSGQRLQTCGVTDVRLVINPFDVQGACAKKKCTPQYAGDHGWNGDPAPWCGALRLCTYAGTGRAWCGRRSCPCTAQHGPAASWANGSPIFRTS